MTDFINGTIRVKNTGNYLNGYPIFEVFELVNGELDGGKSWHFCTTIAATNASQAFQEYEEFYE